MIRLASDPNASRTAGRSMSLDARSQPATPRGDRPGHAWPFLSRPVLRPQAQGTSRPPRGDSTS
jgi:hypothetical protein